ncbi:TetR/AcrR family transcriptional regulator [Streptococcus himalayensis]|uniref:TetR family transcriptional regulator n=1 Tax=Streptococcus himalayensis TaxID=1888195 RepID=A0A917A9P2_9STRE|nr:TetR/AcrR family transcriptional regulator [Streptococcus himalayensis]GGE36364.1 TetR family transcriptional regulator [Streptococcus himalayensis]
MSERKISEKSLANLRTANEEVNRLTKEALEIAFLQLLEQKKLAKITISELVERAGVSRAAFYRNYGSKDELLEKVFTTRVQKITDQLGKIHRRTDLYHIWLVLLKEAKKESRLISLAVDYQLERVLTSAVFDFLEKRTSSKQSGSSYLNSFWSSAIVSVLIKWISDGMKVPAEKVASLGMPLLPQKQKKKAKGEKK